jgi:pectate lyase
VIIRNIAFSNASVNPITIQVKSHHVWVDHCSFTNATDTLMDIKRQASFVTVSWSVFTNTLETILQGHSDSFTQDIGFLKVTYHHNWFDGTQTRHPRVRFAEPVHVFNNYYLNISGYGVASTENAGVLVEGNFFDHVPTPTSLQEGSSTQGRLVARNNIFSNSGNPVTRGTVVEPSTFYHYMLDNTSAVPNIVKSGAGTGKI